MSTDLFQALTLGLLVIVILALLVAVSMLGKVRAALETRPVRDEAEPPTGTQTERAGEGAGSPVDAAVAEVAGTDAGAPASTAGGSRLEDHESSLEPAPDEAVEDEQGASTGVTAEADSERPFERGGRWYFRRGGELLVYEEGTGEWVPAADDDASPAIQRQVAAVQASTEPTVAEAEKERSATGATTEPSTSFAGQPLAAAEEQVESLGGENVVDEGAVTASFEEPGGGGVDLDEAAAIAEDPAPRTDDTFWKCASCGAINGSTAASCRMCFAARP